VIRTIADLFYQALARDLPDAMVFKRGAAYVPLSHAEIQATVERLALALREEGLQAGDRVALLAENCPEWALADYACAITGIITVPVYPTLMPAQTAYILHHSGSRLVFCSTLGQLGKVLATWDQLPALEIAVLLEGDPAEVTAKAPGRRILRFQDLVASGRQLEASRAQVRVWAGARDADQILTLIYTSGTTGEPKGAILTHGNLVSNILRALEILHLAPGMRSLSFLPLSHIFERMGGHYTMFHCGVSIHFVADLDTLPQAFLEVRPEVFLGVPRVFEKVHAKVREAVDQGGAARRMIFRGCLWVGRKVAARRFNGAKAGLVLGCLYALADRAVFAKVRNRLGGRVAISASGGGPLNPNLLEFFWAAGVPVFEGYGLSETSPILTLPAWGQVRPGFVGPPILDQWQGAPFLKLAEDGEILVKGPNVTPGYWDNPQATAEAFDPDGYFRTGDIGAFDEAGRLRITDRKKDLLVTSGGKNVAPQPLERLLTQDPYIAQAVVIGDQRNFLGAILVPELGHLRHWAEHQGLGHPTDAELVARPEVRAKLMTRVERINEHLANHERIRKIVLIHEEMTQEAGFLTPSLKLKRKTVNERFAHQINALYAGGEARPKEDAHVLP
jgi:long-chain acyl-CoA synthetase